MRNNSNDDALIVGSGHSGLTLAMGLAQDGWRVEMTTRQTLGELLGGPPRITRPFLPFARAQERLLGLDVWSDTAPQVDLVEMILADPGGQSTTIRTRLSGLATSVDRRLATAMWFQALEAHGVVPLVQHSTQQVVEYLLRARPYDLAVIAAGSQSDLAEAFPVDPGRTAAASDRVIVQAHVETSDWGSDEARLIVFSNPDVEVIICPVLAYERITQDQVLALSGEDQGAAARNLQIDPFWSVCVQVIARPGGAFAPDPVPTDKRIPAHDRFLAAWDKAMGALHEQAPELAERYRHAPRVPGSELIQHVMAQVRRPVTLMSGIPVLGIGGVTMSPHPASGQGAAVSALVATTVRSQIRERRAAPSGPFDADFLNGAWSAFDAAHGSHANTFGTFVDAYWNPEHPHHTRVRQMVAALEHAPEQAAAWGQGIDQPALMASLLR
ncbi:hypothetical protein ABZ234_08520 [Nocardiopsis sp. NPDC006198]|uniref:hypothetical protein n=1 Tax=Nocardiopsis sp. NPDC006198 TaxID=3154472 RepID=UPI0033A2E65D